MNKYEFGRHKNIKTALNQRLIAEGRDGDYRNFVQALKLSGVDESGDMAAWKIAAFAFAPVAGGPGELMADPMFEKIAADWAAGKYPEPPGFAKFPSGMTNFDKLNGEPSPEFKAEVKRVKSAKVDYENEWQELAAKVDDSKQAEEVEIIRWVFDHCDLKPNRIDPETVPCVGAVRLLRHANGGEGGYRDFLNAWLKLMPDRKALEYGSKFRDDGRDLLLLSDFEASLPIEEPDTAPVLEPQEGAAA